MAEYKGAAKEGARAMALMKKREKMKADIEAAKNKISEVRFCEVIFEIVSSTLTFTETFVDCSFQATIVFFLHCTSFFRITECCVSF